MTTPNPAFFRVIFAKGKPDQVVLTDILGPNRIKSVELEVSEKKLSSCKVQVRNITKAALDVKAMQEETPFTLQYGVQGLWQKERTLHLKEVDTKYEGNVSADLVAVDDRAHAALTKSGRVWSNKTASEIAIDIAKVYGWKTKRIVATTKKYVNVVVGHKSLSQVLVDLAWQENFKFLVEDSMLVFEPAYDMSKSKYHRYTYFVDKDSRVKSFRVKSTTVAAAGAATGAGKSRKAEQEKALAEKLAKMSIPPQEFFRTGAIAALYSQFDEEGVPTHDAAGEKLSKSACKNLKKDWEKQKKLYESSLSK